MTILPWWILFGSPIRWWRFLGSKWSDGLTCCGSAWTYRGRQGPLLVNCFFFGGGWWWWCADVFFFVWMFCFILISDLVVFQNHLIFSFGLYVKYIFHSQDFACQNLYSKIWPTRCLWRAARTAPAQPGFTDWTWSNLRSSTANKIQPFPTWFLTSPILWNTKLFVQLIERQVVFFSVQALGWFQSWIIYS